MPKVLVTYASKYGSTTEIAEAISETLMHGGALEVDCFAVSRVTSITGYDAIILGSALYIGQWQPAAVAFMHDYAEELVAMPVWLFASGPAGSGDPKVLMKSWFLYPPTLRTLISQIDPHDFRLFHGKLDAAKLDPIEQVIVKKVNAQFGDFRRWDEIRAWAEGIRAALLSTDRHPAPQGSKMPANGD